MVDNIKDSIPLRVYADGEEVDLGSGYKIRFSEDIDSDASDCIDSAVSDGYASYKKPTEFPPHFPDGSDYNGIVKIVGTHNNILYYDTHAARKVIEDQWGVPKDRVEDELEHNISHLQSFMKEEWHYKVLFADILDKDGNEIKDISPDPVFVDGSETDRVADKQYELFDSARDELIAEIKEQRLLEKQSDFGL